MNDRPGFFLYDDGGEFTARCAMLCRGAGFDDAPRPEQAVFAIAPRWQKIIPSAELSAPVYGVLVFHPSALPYGRGPDAVRWTIARRERVSAATWFWADSGLDTGPVAAQELVILDPDESPGRAYHARFVPAGLRALMRALLAIAASSPARSAQDNRLATYDGKFQPRPPLLADSAS